MEGVTVLGMEALAGGMQITCTFDADEKFELGRVHTFLLSYDHPEFGNQLVELREFMEELVWEVEHNYRRQPKGEQ